jgi:hypothetical protein
MIIHKPNPWDGVCKFVARTEDEFREYAEIASAHVGLRLSALTSAMMMMKNWSSRRQCRRSGVDSASAPLPRCAKPPAGLVPITSSSTAL